MRHLIKIAALPAALLLLAACGPDDPDTDAADPDPPEDAEVEDEDADPIVLGLLPDLSGPLAVGGIPAARGYEAYFEHLNETEDGVAGRPVEMISQDTGYDPQQSVQVYRDMREEIDLVGFVLGEVPTSAIADLVDEDGTVAGVITKDAAVARQDHLFASFSPNSADFANAVHWIVEEHGGGVDIGVLHTTAPFSEGGVSGIEAAVDNTDAEIVAAETYALGDTDFSEQIRSLAAADPDWILAPVGPADTPAAMGAALAQGLEIPWLTNAGGFTSEVLEGDAGPYMTEHLTVACDKATWGEDVPGMSTLQEVVAERAPDMEGEANLVSGWAMAMLTHALMESAAEEHGEITGETVRASLDELEEADMQGIVPDVSFADDPIPHRDIRMCELDPDSVDGLAPITDLFVYPTAEEL